MAPVAPPVRFRRQAVEEPSAIGAIPEAFCALLARGKSVASGRLILLIERAAAVARQGQQRDGRYSVPATSVETKSVACWSNFPSVSAWLVLARPLVLAGRGRLPG